VLARAQGIVVAVLALVLAAPAAHAADPITPLRDVHRGLRCTARTVVQGTDIASFDVEVLDVVAGADVNGGALILVRVSGPAVAGTGVAEGFSGSPVYCPDAQGRIGNAGAISATVGQYGEDVALVTPIEQMLGLALHPPSGVRRAPKLLKTAHPLAAPLTIAGLAPPLRRAVQREAARHHRAIVAAPLGPVGSFAPQPLVPGATVSVMLSSGAVTAGAVGTVTYRDGDRLYAFGHPLQGAGRRSLMVGDGYVFAVIGNPLDVEEATSYKLAAPGHVLGTFSNDALAGMVGSVGAPPPSVPVTVTVRDRDRHRTLRQRTDVADETDVGNPSGTSSLEAVAPFAVAQAVVSAYDGAPAEETGQLCLHVRLREARAPLRFCKRYVLEGSIGEDELPPLALAMGGDVEQALAVIASARFARLHVTEVTAGVTIARGLRLATILDAQAPRRVRRGHTAPVRLRVRVAHGPLRTIRFRIAIPSDARKGAHALLLSGTPAGAEAGDSDSGEAGSMLAALLGLGGDGGPPPPESVEEIAALFGGLGAFDGVTARLTGERWHAYRDPRMRLDGSAAVELRVG
jgi:hypothetical protein